MSSSSSCPSSSSTKFKWKYDVFLSFRGVDSRAFVTCGLYNALSQAGIYTFVDDEALEGGSEISTSLLGAIEGSRIAIVVFSQRYATSVWCLEELVKIMECRGDQGLRVLPLFYHVDPSDVRNQTGSYGEAMEKQELRFKKLPDRVSAWRKALTYAANLSGFHLSRSGSDEQKMIDDVVQSVIGMLDTTKLFVAEHPVGIELRVHDFTNELLLEGRSQDVRIIGIWGMGGLGKTTLAKAIYNKISHQFEGTSFLANIREVSEQDNGLITLQDQLISDIIKTKILKTVNVDRGKNTISERFPHKKAFVVLDDVDSLRQLKALCGSRKWFGPGSVVIITTRDGRVLNNNILKVDSTYKMKEMDESESLQLFSWHAFKQETPTKNFIELSREVVAYCGGLPLALEVLGSHLFDREIKEWMSVVSKLKVIPHDEIQAKLRISFDGLKDYMQKDIFLDLCCFFINKDRNYVTQILNGCGLHAEDGIQILKEKSLINISSNNKLGMHDLLRDMGREIIRGNPPKDPEDRSRIWFHKDAQKVLEENTGTKVIEGIALKLFRTNKEASINSEAFKAMKKLRLLELDFVKLAGDFKYISRELRWLSWHGFPFKYTPNNLFQQNLVAIDFKYSSLEHVWKEPLLLDGLKILNLSHSCNLTQTPDFRKSPNLEKLILKDCPRLTEVHESIGSLNNLVLVNLKDCKCLRDLPRSIYKLKSLKTLVLSGCSMMDKLEEDFEQMESLTILMADKTAITQVPRSLARSKSLGYIDLCGHQGRSQDIFPSLIWSWMSPRNIPQFSHLQNSSFHVLSNASQISCIEKAYASSSYDYNRVHIARQADSFNPLVLPMGVCNTVDILKERILKGWNYGGFDDSLLPGDQYPDWFIYKGEGCSVFFKVPQVMGYCLKGMILNIVHSSCIDNMISQFVINVLIVNHTKGTLQLHKRDSMTCQEDEEWQAILSSIAPADEVTLSIGCQLTINKIVAYLVYQDSGIAFM